jgi:hypothetical protein
MFQITDFCISCGFCEPVCPVGAISSESRWYVISTDCDDCQGVNDGPKCIAVCRADRPEDCIVREYTVAEMSAGLSSLDETTRLIFSRASGKERLSSEQVERGLVAVVGDIRAAFSQRTDFTPSPIQIERGLTDRVDGVRLGFARRKDFTPSPQQIERGLTDPSDEVREAFSERIDFTPTPEQIERSLTDRSIGVRCGFANRVDFILTPPQVSRGLADEAAGVSSAFYRRTAWNDISKFWPSPRQGGQSPKLDRTDGAKDLKRISAEFLDELTEANKRLAQFITPREVLAGIQKAAENKSWILLQPGGSGYAWSDRTVPMVFIVAKKNTVRFRVRRGHSYRGNNQTPAVWPELRGFPGGEVGAKITEWISASDGGKISLKAALLLPKIDLTCSVDEWKHR